MALPDRVAIARVVILFGTIVEALLMYDRYGGHRSGMEGAMIYMCYGLVLPGFIVVNLPAWLLLRRLGVEADAAARIRLLAFAILPLLVVVVVGIVILFGDWDKLPLLLVPTVPSLLAVAAVAFWPGGVAEDSASQPAPEDSSAEQQDPGS